MCLEILRIDRRHFTPRFIMRHASAHGAVASDTAKQLASACMQIWALATLRPTWQMRIKCNFRTN